MCLEEKHRALARQNKKASLMGFEIRKGRQMHPPEVYVGSQASEGALTMAVEAPMIGKQQPVDEQTAQEYRVFLRFPLHPFP